MTVDESDAYVLRDELPDPETFAHLREVAGMGPRSLEAIERGLPNTIYGVIAVHEPSGEVIGMGRLVGDGGAVYQISDMAVHPDHQGKGLGTGIMDRLEAHLEAEAPAGAYVNLVADVDDFYERFGYEPVRPGSKGMHRRIE
ncbi:Acetyltransferase (GNAT) domain-containing protein [Natronorubrum sediminis]|uniref:Acetyltransferase (GNAT) domain-containing protein n=1 Tax=Natronorubrum sediminis TaxID=640943 RepID=A0A1H6G6D3_9EURY|nr:GNAT family N-acetyltransferase [Natronorubrum sediminis]SEH17544.1 Acetyltransferase (GNAT) domain-containing protein [Natronorubrum sediminis]